MLKNLVYLALFLDVLMQHEIPAFQPATENNHALVGHVFKQLFARDWFNCIQACHDEPRCISYNYERSARGNGLCELNNYGVDGLGHRDKSLFLSKGFVFQQIREIKASPPRNAFQAPSQQVTSQQPTPTTGSFSCASAGEGFHPDPSDCSKFIQCYGGQEYRSSCHRYLLFNPKRKKCDLPQNVSCA